MPLVNKVTLREVGPREGFQTLSKVYPLEDKLRLIEALSRTGIKYIETTSFVRPDKVPQMADAEELVSKLKPVEGIEYSALYLNQIGFKKAESNKILSNRGWINVATSETFLKRNSNTTLDKIIAEMSGWIELFKEYRKNFDAIMVSTAFGCNYEGEIPTNKVIEVIGKVILAAMNLGSIPKEVCLADTVGLGESRKIKEVIEGVKSKFPNQLISLHLHDTRGTGMVNVYEGLHLGVDCFDVSVGGMGGCPFAKGAAGNVCGEDVAYLCAQLGVETGINLEKYVEAAKLAANIIGYDLPGKLYKTFDKSY